MAGGARETLEAAPSAAPADGDGDREILAARIADRLREDILRDVLKPGAKIKERETAAALGVSRTPLREAIRMLASEGLVTLRPSRSPVVAAPSIDEIVEHAVVMKALEVLSGRLACEAAGEAELAAIAAMHERMVEMSDRADEVAFFNVDMAFHAAVAEAGGNRALTEAHRGFVARLWRARFLSARIRKDRARVLGQHGEIVAGLQARDPDRVAAVIESHIDRMIRNVAEVYAERAPREAARRDA